MRPGNEPTTTLRSRLVVPPSAALMPVVVETLDAVDRVHRVPASLPRATLEWVSTGGPQGRFHPATEGRAGRIAMSESADMPRTTFLHEVGHLLDYWLGGSAGFASRKETSPLAPALTEARKSVPCLRLQDTAAGETTRLWRRAYIAGYLLSSEELRARAYAQYIAARSDNAALRREIADVRRETDFNQYRQWADDEFEQIASAIDRALREMGWLQP